jgi:hypothetical protein
VREIVFGEGDSEVGGYAVNFSEGLLGKEEILEVNGEREETGPHG